MNCRGCKFAKWDVTKAGKLHPSGSGRCMWQYPEIQLPASMYFVGRSPGDSPKPCGGQIDRKLELPRGCPCREEI